MLTSLGKALRRIRLDRDLYLKDMADALGIKPSYLCSIENGKRNPTRKIISQLVSIYNLSTDETAMLEEAYAETMQELTLNLQSAEVHQNELGLVLARKFNTLTPEQTKAIQNILEEVK